MRRPDVWWAERIAGGREIGPGVREVIVGDEPLELAILQSRAWTARYHRRVSRLLSMLIDVKWSYPRAITTLAVQAVAATCALVARSLLPPTWRPGRLYWVAVASPGTYAVLRLGAHTGWSKRFKHTVLDWFDGDVDDAQTWMLGVLSSAGILLLPQLVKRGLRLINSPPAGIELRTRISS